MANAAKLANNWYEMFKAHDSTNRGFIYASELRRKIEQSGEDYGLSADHRDAICRFCDSNSDKKIDFEDLCFMLSHAKNLRAKTVLFRAARAVVPKSQREEKFSYLHQYNCMPPPLFMIFVTIVELIFYIYYVVDMNDGISISGPVPFYSPLIYDPIRRYQIWRYFSYMLLGLGIPLELVHKFWRIGLIYLIGVFAGSLAVSFTDPKVYLAGASGGVYALIAAHVANLAVNWSEMEYNWVSLIFLTAMVGTDFGVALYNRYYSGYAKENSVSYVAHIGGFVAGLLMGIVVLRNYKQRTWERVAWWVALVGGLWLAIMCICWNIWYPQYDPPCYDPPFRTKTGPACAPAPTVAG